ncbi:1477_t:CDS:2, partial [Acaulospora morrowiae]
EFIINLHEQNQSLTAFKKALNDAGAEFPESFVVNLDRLIQKMNPIYKLKGKEKIKIEETTNDYSLDEKVKDFPAIIKDEEDTKVATDALAQLEGLEAMLRTNKMEVLEKENSNNHEVRSHSRSRKRVRERSHSPPYRRRRNRSS